MLLLLCGVVALYAECRLQLRLLVCCNQRVGLLRYGHRRGLLLLLLRQHVHRVWPQYPWAATAKSPYPWAATA